MTAVHHLPASDPAGVTGTVTVDDGRVVIDHLAVDDQSLATLLGPAAPQERPALAARALEVGARSLLSAGLGIDVDAVDARIRRITEEAERRVARLLDEGRAAFAASFDPEQRSSLLGRAMDDFDRWRDTVLAGLDPERADSHTTVFLERLAGVLGPDGLLERRLAEAFDPEADGSALGSLAAAVERGFTELRDLVVHERGRAEGSAAEAERGTAQGFEFEDRVEAWLRAEAAAVGSCVVERTSGAVGAVAGAKVGDFVVTLPDGIRVVVEAKHQATLTLAGSSGVLPELDRAMANREAAAAVCVSGKDAFPAEVGRFGVYGDRVLVVADGDGTMLAVALRWAIAAARAAAAGGEEFDAAAALDRVERIRALGTRISTAQARLTQVRDSVNGVKEALGELRTDLLDLGDDLHRRLAGAAGGRG